MGIPNLIVQLYLALQYLVGVGATTPLLPLGALPEDLKECSGMAALNDSSIVMVNDSGNDAELFICDTTGQLHFREKLPELHNVDWESLACLNNILYVGDFGNNSNRRKDLIIYRLDMSAFFSTGQIVSLEPITFRYYEQKRFPPKAKNKNFDLEAMVAINDSIYLFTKNRTVPFSGYTYCYGLPAKPGHYEIKRIDSVFTGGGIRASHWITGASYHPQKAELLLLGYDKLWRFTNSHPGNFFKEEAEIFHFNDFSQKEAITHLGGKIYLSDEKNSDADGMLYRVILPQSTADQGQ